MRQPRASTFLGRLSRALREQNWLAAGIELGIVVLGVVIGFQITAWGEARSDRAKEAAYLRQLVADLQETERRFAEADQRVAFADEGRTRLLHAFWGAGRLPEGFGPVLGGRSGVLRGSPLRAGHRHGAPVDGRSQPGAGRLDPVLHHRLRRGRGTVRRVEPGQYVQVILANSRRIWERLDVLEGTFALLSRARMDSTARARDVWYYPPGAERSAFSNDVPAFLRDREAYGIVMSMFDAGSDMKRSRRRFRRMRHNTSFEPTPLRGAAQFRLMPQTGQSHPAAR